MSTQLSTKLAAIAVALAMNSMILGSMALLFDDSARPAPAASAAIAAHTGILPA